MKIIFLDFDGVICTQASYKDAEKKHGLESDGFPPPLHLILKSRVARVQEICDKTGAKIVISSMWRVLYKWGVLKGFLRHHGLTAEIIDQTPSGGLSRDRGLEITQWMQLHPDISWDDIVILDDDYYGVQYYEDAIKRLICPVMWGETPDKEGIQPEQVQEAIEMLS